MYNLIMKTIYTKNKKETEKIGFDLAVNFKGGEILALEGNLGAGKTTFSKGLAKGLNIKKNICSPTFVILNQYKVKSKNINFFYHLDAYRLNTKKDLENIGFFDIIKHSENIVAIEWANKIKKYLPKKTTTIKLSIIKSNNQDLDGQRKIIIS